MIILLRVEINGFNLLPVILLLKILTFKCCNEYFTNTIKPFEHVGQHQPLSGNRYCVSCDNGDARLVYILMITRPRLLI